MVAKYQCRFCGSIYDEEKEGIPVSRLAVCPVCRVSVKRMTLVEEDGNSGEGRTGESAGLGDGAGGDSGAAVDSGAGLGAAWDSRAAQSGASWSAGRLDYDPEFARIGTGDRYMDEIHQMAVTGASIIDAMGTRMPMPGWDDILFLGAQLDPMPLDEHAPVSARTVIGKKAAKPMVLENPVYISHMSFGALSRETKIALARGSAMAKTAMCSGEGGILPEERAAAYRYIFEYVPNLYSVTDENLRQADAIEIKIGQGTKPGMGGHLPGAKVTPEIAAVRGKPVGQDVISPSRFPGLNSREDLKALVARLKERSEGRPVGVKIAAGRIERDLAFCLYADPDFITIDGRGGATGASPKLIRDATSVPTVYALHRARKFLDAAGSQADLVITGGLRVSSDFAKALAMGVDAVAVASSALIAAACQQYRICGTGMCPVGVATQDPGLRARFPEEAAARRVANFLNVSLEEIKTFARITGHEDVHEMCVDDLCTVSREISEYTDIAHA